MQKTIAINHLGYSLTKEGSGIGDTELLVKTLSNRQKGFTNKNT